MTNIKLALAKIQSSYHVVAQLDSGDTISYMTKDESLAEDVLNFTRKVVGATDETGDTPIFEVGETGDGDYMIMATIGDDYEYFFNVEKQRDAYEIDNFLTTIFEED